MDSNDTGAIALLSVHPRFASALLQGTKKVEFRKTRFSKDVRLVVVYATSPITKIVGYFSVAQVKVSSPTAIWNQYWEVGGINRTDYREYFFGSRQAVAIEVSEAFPLSEPLSLTSVGTSTPPQSYRYLAEYDFAAISANQYV